MAVGGQEEIGVWRDGAASSAAEPTGARRSRARASPKAPSRPRACRLARRDDGGGGSERRATQLARAAAQLASAQRRSKHFDAFALVGGDASVRRVVGEAAGLAPGRRLPLSGVDRTVLRMLRSGFRATAGRGDAVSCRPRWHRHADRRLQGRAHPVAARPEATRDRRGDADRRLAGQRDLRDRRSARTRARSPRSGARRRTGPGPRVCDRVQRPRGRRGAPARDLRLAGRRRGPLRGRLRAGALGGDARLRDRPLHHPAVQLPRLPHHAGRRCARSRRSPRRRGASRRASSTSRFRSLARTTRSGCSRAPSTT